MAVSGCHELDCFSFFATLPEALVKLAKLTLHPMQAHVALRWHHICTKQCNACSKLLIILCHFSHLPQPICAQLRWTTVSHEVVANTARTFTHLSNARRHQTLQSSLQANSGVKRTLRPGSRYDSAHSRFAQTLAECGTSSCPAHKSAPGPRASDSARHSICAIAAFVHALRRSQHVTWLQWAQTARRAMEQAGVPRSQPSNDAEQQDARAQYPARPTAGQPQTREHDSAVQQAAEHDAGRHAESSAPNGLNSTKPLPAFVPPRAAPKLAAASGNPSVDLTADTDAATAAAAAATTGHASAHLPLSYVTASCLQLRLYLGVPWVDMFLACSDIKKLDQHRPLIPRCQQCPCVHVAS